MRRLFVVFSAIFFLHANSVAALPEVQTVNSVNLQKYLGKWFEFAAMPQFFEIKCVANTTAEYSLAKNGRITVINGCDVANGTREVAIGSAKVVDTSSNAKLKVTFVTFFFDWYILGGDYWIIAIDEQYSYAVVVAPSRDYAWILSRTPQMNEEQLRGASQALVRQGFDTCKLISTIHAGGSQTKTPFCQLVRN